MERHHKDKLKKFWPKLAKECDLMILLPYLYCLTNNEKEPLIRHHRNFGNFVAFANYLPEALYRKKDGYQNLLEALMNVELEYFVKEIDINFYYNHSSSVTQYPLPAVLQIPEPNEATTINMSQFKPDILATADGMIRLLKRHAWGAQERKGEVARLCKPIQYVIFTHTAGIGSFVSTNECVQGCRHMQELNFSWGLSDIACNYLIGNDGIIYEGRGHEIEGLTTRGWKAISLGIAFIGKYVNTLPSSDALDVAKTFLQYLVDQEILTRDFTIHCLRQVCDIVPDFPGDLLYEKIRKWRGVGPRNTWSWREQNSLAFYQKFQKTGPTGSSVTQYPLPAVPQSPESNEATSINISQFKPDILATHIKEL